MNYNDITAGMELLKSFFNTNNALISTPVFLESQGGKVVTVQLSYYLGPNARAFSNNTLKTLANSLSYVYGTGPSVHLELVRQHRPYMNASILAQYLAINVSTQGFNRISNLLLNAVPYLNPNYVFTLMIPDHLAQGTGPGASSITGVKVELAGLLTSQRNRSRKTVYTASAGTFSHLNEYGHESLVVDNGSYTYKSGLGAFTVKVHIASRKS